MSAITVSPQISGPTGIELLDNPALNKGTAFSAAERRQHGLEGLLPANVETIERQLDRVLGHLDQKPNDLERYVYLMGLCDRNETLFYKTLMSDPARFVPIVYDPTIADACLTFGHLYRRSRGMYITRDMKGRMADVLRNWPTAWASPLGNCSSTLPAPRSHPVVCCQCCSTLAPPTPRCGPTRSTSACVNRRQHFRTNSTA